MAVGIQQEQERLMRREIERQRNEVKVIFSFFISAFIFDFFPRLKYQIKAIIIFLENGRAEAGAN